MALQISSIWLIILYKTHFCWAKIQNRNREKFAAIYKKKPNKEGREKFKHFKSKLKKKFK